MPSQQQVIIENPSVGEADKHYGNPILNLENTFIYIDGKRHNVVDLLKLVAEKLKP